MQGKKSSLVCTIFPGFGASAAKYQFSAQQAHAVIIPIMLPVVIVKQINIIPPPECLQRQRIIKSRSALLFGYKLRINHL